MRSSSPDSPGATKRAALRAARPSGRRWCSGRQWAVVRRGLSLAGLVGAAIAISAAPAVALSSSQKVLLIPGPGPAPAPPGMGSQDGIMPTSTTVAGRSDESFGGFSFTSLQAGVPVSPSSPITTATLSKYDTVALIQVHTGSLSASAKAALAQFVASGGKLLIHDSDETHGNDYSWLLPKSSPTQVGLGCNFCGSTSGSALINADSGLISANPSDHSYVSIPELAKYTDAIGDGNLLTSLDPRWFTAVTGKNGNHESGALVAYATSGKGLIVYSGFDTDMIMPTASSPWRCINTPQDHCTAATGHPTEDWLAQMWYNELTQSWGPSASSLPQTTPVSSVGTPVSPSQAGLPSPRACVARHRVYLRLKTLVRHHRQIVRIDVYVNGRHRLRERRHHWHNVTLRRLPKTGSVVIKVVATTRRHYHLISRVRYHAC